MMFTDTGNITNRKSGWIEVICGSMFSGKTEELIRRLNRALIANQSIGVFKPEIDKRYHWEKIVSHSQASLPSQPVASAREILEASSACDVVGIDEAQFFDEEIVTVTRKLADEGKRVVLAGLDMDFQGRPFSPVDQLMARAEYVTKLHAVCKRCGGAALYTYRKIPSDKKIIIGEKDIYEALCRGCFIEAMAGS